MLWMLDTSEVHQSAVNVRNEDAGVMYASWRFPEFGSIAEDTFYDAASPTAASLIFAASLIRRR